MIQHCLDVEARNRPEVMERILRVVRHRGFRLHSLNMAVNKDDENISIQLSVVSQRSIELLCSQLNKLPDVARVSVQQMTSQQIHA